MGDVGGEYPPHHPKNRKFFIECDIVKVVTKDNKELQVGYAALGVKSNNLWILGFGRPSPLKGAYPTYNFSIYPTQPEAEKVQAILGERTAVVIITFREHLAVLDFEQGDHVHRDRLGVFAQVGIMAAQCRKTAIG